MGMKESQMVRTFDSVLFGESNAGSIFTKSATYISAIENLFLLCNDKSLTLFKQQQTQ